MQVVDSNRHLLCTTENKNTCWCGRAPYPRNSHAKPNLRFARRERIGEKQMKTREPSSSSWSSKSAASLAGEGEVDPDRCCTNVRAVQSQIAQLRRVLFVSLTPTWPFLSQETTSTNPFVACASIHLQAFVSPSARPLSSPPPQHLYTTTTLNNNPPQLTSPRKHAHTHTHTHTSSWRIRGQNQHKIDFPTSEALHKQKMQN